MNHVVRLGLGVLYALAVATPLLASDGVISGTIRFGEGKEPARGVRVLDSATKKVTFTNGKGQFTLKGIDAGTHAISLHSVALRDTTISVKTNGTDPVSVSVDMAITENTFDAVIVYGASKRAEKVTETPAAVTVMTPIEIQRASRGNQLGRALEGMTGVDVVQNGATDFNVNTRGFNNSTNRRLLVLVDGRDVSLQQIGATEWNSFAMPLDEFSSIELVRGPAAALYGANAFNGVLNMTTLSPRESQGTKVTLLGGDYKAFRADARHAGVLGDLAYKVTFGHSQSLNLAQNRTDSASMVAEYPSLWPAAREFNTVTAEDRETFATYGTVRMDYSLSPTQTILGEFGYSQFGNEIMLAGSGRIHVPKSEKPFARLAYHDTHFHVQTVYNARRTIDTMRILAAPPGTIILDNSYDVDLDAQYNNTAGDQITYTLGTQLQHMSIGSNGTVFYPNDPITANIGGVYGQVQYKPTDQWSFVGSARYDNASIYPQQFSPRLAVVFSPVAGQQFRVTAGRSFQRANFSELYRRYGFRPALTAQGRPVNFRPVQASVNDTLSKLTGTSQNVDLGLYDTTVTSPTNPQAIQPIALGVGNPDLNVEENIGYEFGYKGVLGTKLFLTVDVYYNRMRNFISGFLPGVNANYTTWNSNSRLPDNLKQYQGLVDSMVYKALQEQDRARFTTYNNNAAFIVSNTNLGLVEQYGVELGAEFLVTERLKVNANYAYYHANLIDAKTTNPFLQSGDMLLSPNTSPNRVNIGASYTVPGSWDVSVMWRWVDGFNWLAGDFKGYVPTYNVFNLNAGLQVMDELHVGLAITNVFDFRHYEIYGGSNIPRLAYLSASYTIN